MALIAIGVGVGVSVSHKNRTKTSGNNSNSNSTNNNSSNPVTQSDPNDPSTFEKDPRLKQSFYGIAYEPNGVIYPACGAVLSDVITDIQLLSQLTKVRQAIFRSSRSRRLLYIPYLNLCANFPRGIVAYPDLRRGLRPFTPRPRGDQADQG